MTLARIALTLLAAAPLTLAACEPDGPDTNQAACTQRQPGVMCSVAGTGIAGDGADLLAPLETRLYAPVDVAFDQTNRLFIVDWNNHRIRALRPDGKLQIVAGVGELLVETGTDLDLNVDRLNHPTDITFDPAGRMVIAAWHNSRIKVVDLTTGAMINSCGNGTRSFSGDDGPALMAGLNLPAGVLFDREGNLLVSDQANQRIRKVDANGVITTVAGSGERGYGGDEGPAKAATFNLPVGQAGHPAGHIAMDAAGNLYLADTDNHRIRVVDTAGTVTTFAGNGTLGATGDGGPATAAQLNRPVDVAVGPDGGLYIADTENNCVRVVRGGIISTVAGTCGTCRGIESFACTCPGLDPTCLRDGVPAPQALLRRPTGIAFDQAGNLYIADSFHHRVRVVYR